MLTVFERTGSGQVIEIGEGVTSVKVGDRVAVEAGIPCGECEFCRIGRYNACPTVVFFSTPPYHGTLVRDFWTMNLRNQG